MIDTEGKFVFLSGPITGLERDDAWQRFLDAEMACIGVGAKYDLLVSLPGWEESDGARLERAVAEAIGIPCAELGGE